MAVGFSANSVGFVTAPVRFAGLDNAVLEWADVSVQPLLEQ